MADPSQLMQFAFATGIDQSQRDEVLEPTAGFLTLENVRQTKRGGVGKRYGFTALTLSRLSGSRSAGYKLFAAGDNIAVIDGHQLDIYSSTASAFITKDRVPECVATRVALPWPGFNPSFANCIYANGYYVVCASVTGGTSICLFVVDATTFAIVAGPQSYTGLTSLTDGPQLAAVGSTVAVFYGSAANTVSARTISLASSSSINTGWSSATSLFTDMGAGRGFDAHGLEDRFAVAYNNNSGGTNRLTVTTFNASLVQQETTTLSTASTNVAQTALAGTNADTLWVGWCQGTDVKVAGLTGNSLATVLASTLAVFSFATNAPKMIGISAQGSGVGRLIATEGDTGITKAQSFTTSGGAATASGSTQTWYNVQAFSRPFRVDGRDYCSVFYSTDGLNTQGTHIVVDIEATAALRPVANVAPRLVTTTTDGATHQVASVSSTKKAVAHVVSRTGGLGIGQGRAVELVVLDFGASNRWAASRHAGVSYLTGGVSTFFDGHRVRETNFLARPVAPTVGIGAAGSVTGTNLRYIAVLERFDANGNCEMSAPSDPSSTVSPAAQQVTVTIPTLGITAQQDTSSSDTENPPRFAVYRSSDNGTLPYYRVGTVDNVTSAATVTYTDNTASVTSSAVLYRQPGQAGAAQPRSCPPGLHHLTSYNESLVGVGDDLVTLWQSGEWIIGEGVWFADAFQYPVAEGGSITALGAQDGTLYVFKRRSIFAVAGEVPSANGATGGLGTPRRLAVDVGCIDARSVVVTAMGIFFQSERGIELLTRGQSVEWIGEPIQDTVASYPVCTSATLDASQNLVLFELASSELSNQVSGTGRTAVYDLTLRTWVSTDRRKNQAGTADTPAQGGCIVWSGSAYRYAWLGTDGRVYVEDRSTYLDPGSAWVTMRAETAWIKMAGIQGWQQIDRALLLAAKSTDHDVAVSFGFDYSASYATTRSFTRATINALAREQLEVVTGNDDRCQAMRVKIQDSTPTGGTVGTGEGATWVALTFEGIVDRSVYRLGSGAR